MELIETIKRRFRIQRMMPGGGRMDRVIRSNEEMIQLCEYLDTIPAPEVIDDGFDSLLKVIADKDAQIAALLEERQRRQKESMSLA